MSSPPTLTCTACGRANDGDAAFCAGCGTSLATPACPSCGRPARPGDRFCPGCGTALDGHAAPAAATPGQRRHLTVMFTDLADSTRLSGELDPEDMRDLYRGYQAACTDAIVRHSGYPAQYMGDGVLAYFGYPQAHEDDGRLAIAAGLEIVTAVAALRGAASAATTSRSASGSTPARSWSPRWAARSAVQDHTVVGETPNVAARLQSLAAPDTVIVSGATRELVEGFYELEDLGEQALKGVVRPIRAYRATRSTAAATRLDAGADRGLTPLVGRGRELLRAARRLGEAAGGDGRVVLLSGEPGIGKSRLVHELAQRSG